VIVDGNPSIVMKVKNKMEKEDKTKQKKKTGR